MTAPTDEKVAALVAGLRQPVRSGGTNSEDAWEAYDEMRLAAAAMIEALSRTAGAGEPVRDWLVERAGEWVYDDEPPPPGLVFIQLYRAPPEIAALTARVVMLERERDVAQQSGKEMTAMVMDDMLHERARAEAAEHLLAEARKALEIADGFLSRGHYGRAWDAISAALQSQPKAPDAS